MPILADLLASFLHQMVLYLTDLRASAKYSTNRYRRNSRADSGERQIQNADSVHYALTRLPSASFFESCL